MPQDITGYLYVQENPPQGWDPRLYWVWDGPVHVLLVPKIPSANKVCLIITSTFNFFISSVPEDIQGANSLQSCQSEYKPARGQ